MPQKTWVVGEEVLAADFNSYLQQQVVATFATTAARDAWAAPPNGAVSITLDTYSVWIRRAGAWAPMVNALTRGGYTAVVDVNTAAGGTVALQTVSIAAVPYATSVFFNIALIGGLSTAAASFGVSVTALGPGTGFGNNTRTVQSNANQWTAYPLSGSYPVAAGQDGSFRIDFNGVAFGGGTCHTAGTIWYQQFAA